MTKVAAEPDHAEISATERWELIERIRNSQEFKRALRLRELLLYIGTQSIKSGVTTIHEQEIGGAVFGRSDDYDTSLDNIVRVNVTELRKRLGHYFEDEGSTETLLVEIPRGTYIPIFCRRQVNDEHETSGSRSPHEADETLSPVTNSLELEESPTISMSAGRWKIVSSRGFWVIAGCAVLLCCGMVFFLWQNAILRSEVSPWQADPVRRAFWSEFFGSNEEVDIVTADTSLALAEDILKQPVSLDDYLDYKYKNRVDLPGVTPETRNTINMILGRDLGSVGDFRVAERVMELDAHSSNLKLASARAYAPESIKANNVILIGGPASNPWVELYKDRMDFYVEYDVVRHYTQIINRTPAQGEQSVYGLFAEPNRGYSVVAFLPNLSAHRYALIIAGNDSQATLAAGEWVTSSEGLATIRQKVPNGRFPFFEVLLASSKLVGTPLRTEVEAFRIHQR
ncbi:MAG: hypothetical protein WCA89_02985 [Terracidiphilus sp.]